MYDYLYKSNYIFFNSIFYSCVKLFFGIYSNEAIGDLINRGSFPQFVLQPVNFEAIYAQRIQQQKQQAEAAEH